MVDPTLPGPKEPLNIAIIGPGMDISGGKYMKCWVTEMVCTFIFVSVILNIKFVNGGEDVSNAATVGSTLMCAVMVSAKNSGGCINPAVAIV